MKRAGLVITLLASGALGVASPLAAQEAVPSLIEIRERGFAVTDLEGQVVAFSSLLGEGRPLVVEFWATWCPPCRKNLPTLLALGRKHGDDLVIVGLTVEDPGPDMIKVRDYVERRAIDFPIAFSPRELFQFMNNRPDVAVPKLFVFDRGGQLVTYIPRYSPFTSRRLKSAVRKALSERRRPASWTHLAPIRTLPAQ